MWAGRVSAQHRAGQFAIFSGRCHCLYGGTQASILGVSDELYKTKGSVSPEMAIAMARGVRHLTGTDYGICHGRCRANWRTLGAADWDLLSWTRRPDDLEVAERFHADAGDRDGNKRQAAQAVLDLLGHHLAMAG